MASNVVFNESTGTFVAKGSSDDKNNSSTSSNENFGKSAEEIKADKVKSFRKETNRPNYVSKKGESAAELKSRITKDITKRKQAEKQKQAELLVTFQEGQFKGRQIKASEKFVNKLEQINKQNNSNNIQADNNEPIYTPYKNIPEYLKKKNINKDIKIKPNVNQGTQEINQNYETQVDISTIKADDRTWFQKNVISKSRAFFSSFKKGFLLDKDAGAIQQYGSNVDSAGATLGTISRIGLGAKVAEVGGKGAGIGLAKIKDSSKVAAKGIAIGQKVVKSKSLAVGLGTIYAGNLAVDTYQGVKEEGSIGGVRALSNALSDVTILGSFSKGVSEGYIDTRDIIFKQKVQKSFIRDTDTNFKFKNIKSDSKYNVDKSKINIDEKGNIILDTFKTKNVKGIIDPKNPRVAQTQLKSTIQTKKSDVMIIRKDVIFDKIVINKADLLRDRPMSNKNLKFWEKQALIEGYGQKTKITDYGFKTEKVPSVKVTTKDYSTQRNLNPEIFETKIQDFKIRANRRIQAEYNRINQKNLISFNEPVETKSSLSPMLRSKKGSLYTQQVTEKIYAKPKIETEPTSISKIKETELNINKIGKKDKSEFKPLFLIKSSSVYDTRGNLDNAQYQTLQGVKIEDNLIFKDEQIKDNEFKFSTEQIIEQKQDSKIKTITETDTINKTKISTETKPDLATEQIPFNESINTNKPKIIEDKFINDPFEQKKDKFNLNKFNVNTLNTKKVSKTNFTGFNVLVKKQGKFQLINKKLLSKGSALNLGYSEVDKTSSATFKIIPKFGKISQRDSSPASILKSKFYNKGNLYIEKNKFRIDSVGEKKGITFKSKKKKKRFL